MSNLEEINLFIIIPQNYSKCGEKNLRTKYYEMNINDIRNCKIK